MQGIDAIHKRLKSIKYVEILKFDKERPTTGRKIVISGAPGCGKSTLSRKLCKDLSSGTLHNTYQLVILVELRELVYRMKEGEQLGLKHILMKYPYLSNKKVSNALLYGYGKNVLFILDGYDELDESLRSCQFLRDILSTCSPSLFLSECDVVITTRPVASRELFQLVENPYRNVEILGFTEQHIHVYIDNFFENLENGQVKANKLKEKLEQLPHVRGMCRVPIVLEFVCKVHRILGDQGIPDTQTGIYGTYIVAELFNSKPHSQVSVQDLLIVSEEDFPGFFELCRKAFECCSSTKGQRLLLTEQDVGNLTQYLNRGSMYGLLFAETVESVCGSVRLFHYLHKSIQEMLAAVHIAKLPDKEHAPLWREQFGRPEMAEIWKYYAGITELKKFDTNTLFSLFKKIKKDQKVLLMLSLYEAKNQEVAKKVLPVMFSENEISITARSSYEIVAVNYCIKHHLSLTSFELELIGRKPPIKFGEPLKDTAYQISSHPTLKSLKCSGFKEEDWTLFSDGLVPFKSVSTFDIDKPTSAIFSSIAMNSFDLPDLILVCRGELQGNTPVDEKGLCDVWSQRKCKTVEIRLLGHRYDCLISSVLKGISVNGHVQHLKFSAWAPSLQLHGNHEESHDRMSSLRQLLALRLTCQLKLCLSPAEWAAILCGVGGAEQLEKLDVNMEFFTDDTPVDEQELWEAWSQCKCKTVKMTIDRCFCKSQEVSLLTGVLRGIAQNKTSVEFKLKFYYSDDQSYFMKKIPEDILTHFIRDGDTFTLNPLNSRCPTGGVSSGESPETPVSNPTGEPSNKRRHVEQPPLVEVTESTSSSPAQQVDHVRRYVHSTQSDSSRSSPMSQRASLSQSPISSVGVMVDPSSLVTDCMGDFPQPPCTHQRTHPLASQYKTGQSRSYSTSATSQGISQLMDTSPMLSPVLYPPCDVQTSTGPPQRASLQHHLPFRSFPQESNSPPVSHMVTQQMTRTPHPLAQDSQHMYSSCRTWGPGPYQYTSQGPRMLQHIQNPQSVRHLQPSFHHSQSIPNLHGVEAPFSPPQIPGPHRTGMSQHIPIQPPQYRHTSLQPVQCPLLPSHQSHQRPLVYPYHSQGPEMSQQVPNFQSIAHSRSPSHPNQLRPGSHSNSSQLYPVYSPPPPQGPLPTEDLSHGPWGPGQSYYDLQEPGMLQYFPNPQSVSYPQSILPPYPQYGQPSLQPIQYNQPPFHPSQPRTDLPSSWGYPFYTPPPPQGPLLTEDLPGPSSLPYPPQYYEPHPPYPSTHYSHPPTLSGGSGFDCQQFMETYENRFLQCVDSHAISNMLLLKGVIPSNLSHQLQNMDSTTGTQLLFLHLQEQANKESLLQLCDVMINMAGYHRMSSLGRDMKRDLEQPVNTSTS